MALKTYKMKSNEHSTSYFLDFKIHLAARCFAFTPPFPTAGGLLSHTRVCHLASDIRLRCTNFLNSKNWNISWTQNLKIEIFFIHKPSTKSCWSACTLHAKKLVTVVGPPPLKKMVPPSLVTHPQKLAEIIKNSLY